jgi:dihydroorotase
MNTLLQQVRVIDPVSQTDQIADVLFTENQIQIIDHGNTLDHLPANTKKIDRSGCILAPGLIDLYSHNSQPGFEERETILSLMQAAKAGGFRSVMLLPNTLPAVDQPGAVSYLQELVKQAEINITSPPNLYFWAALTEHLQGEKMTQLAELADSPIIGFTDSQSINSLPLTRRILEYLQPLQKPIALAISDRTLTGKGVMREGYQSLRAGLPGVPSIAETSILSALIELVEYIGTPVHIMRVSTARSVELITDAKRRGVPITASTTWMHLLLNSQSISENPIAIPYDPNLRLNPPLPNPDDQAALIAAVKSGVIDAIAIDHSPYTYEEKTVAFADAPAGAIGLELALPLLWQNLVTTGQLTALELWRSLTSSPAECLGLSMNAIAHLSASEVILFNPATSWQVTPQNLFSRSVNTPWLGQTLQGKVLEIFSEN